MVYLFRYEEEKKRMKTYIGYFDLLGFKDFVQLNEHDIQKQGMQNLFRDIGNAVAKGNLVKLPDGGYVPDLNASKVRVLNFSDTIIFWTEDDSYNSLKEIMNVVYFFNFTSTVHFFPARGTLIHGEIEHVYYNQDNEKGGSYIINSVFGKGIIEAYQKAESAEWSGATIDKSIIDKIEELHKDKNVLMSDYAKLYSVPYKNNKTIEEYAFKLVKEPIDQATYLNYENNIRDNFKNYNKSIKNDAVQLKLKNTLLFLKSSVYQNDSK